MAPGLHHDLPAGAHDLPAGACRHLATAQPPPSYRLGALASLAGALGVVDLYERQADLGEAVPK